MRNKLRTLFFILVILAFIISSIYVLGLAAVILLIAIASLFAYIRYITTIILRNMKTSHEILVKNQTRMAKAIRNLEDRG